MTLEKKIDKIERCSCGRIKSTPNFMEPHPKMSMELSSARNLLIPGALFVDAYRETKNGKSAAFCYTAATFAEAIKFSTIGYVAYILLETLS